MDRDEIPAILKQVDADSAAVRNYYEYKMVRPGLPSLYGVSAPSSCRALEPMLREPFANGHIVGLVDAPRENHRNHNDASVHHNVLPELGIRMMAYPGFLHMHEGKMDHIQRI